MPQRVIFAISLSLLIFSLGVWLLLPHLIRHNSVISATRNTYTIRLNWKGLEKDLKVEISREYEELLTGLMNRPSLDNIDGMLFIFPAEQEQSFWMKNTFIPLDIIFFDAGGKFLNVHKNAAPCIDEESNCPLYPSNGKTKYVLETNAGFLPNEWFEEGLTLDINKI